MRSSSSGTMYRMSARGARWYSIPGPDPMRVSLLPGEAYSSVCQPIRYA